jgi:hypothetical protein
MMTMVLLGMAAVAGGCGHSELETRQRASIAATAKYPADTQPTASLFSVAAVDDAGRGELQLLNLSDAAVPQSTVWVNGRFVSRIETIPARGIVAVRYVHLIEAGQAVSDLAREKQAVTKVELQTPQALVKVLGPARR